MVAWFWKFWKSGKNRTVIFVTKDGIKLVHALELLVAIHSKVQVLHPVCIRKPKEFIQQVAINVAIVGNQTLRLLHFSYCHPYAKISKLLIPCNRTYV